MTARHAVERRYPLLGFEQQLDHAGAPSPLLQRLYVREQGLICVGLDVIGDKLTKTSVAGPTRIRELEARVDVNIAAKLFEAIEKRLGHLRLVAAYLAQAIGHAKATAEPLAAFGRALDAQIERMRPFATQAHEPDPLAETWAELIATRDKLQADIRAFADETAARSAAWLDKPEAPNNAALLGARKDLHGLAERCRDLTKQIDLAAKLAGRVADLAVKELDAKDADHWPNTEITKSKKRWTPPAPRPWKRCAWPATSSARPTGCRSASPTPNCATWKG